MAIRYQPDLIILDILLPDCSGWDVLAQLQKNLTTSSIPVIVISVVVDEYISDSRLRVTDYLLKPITRKQLQYSLNRVFPNPKPPDNPRTGVASLPSLTQPLILLAEDNEANIAVILSYLQAHGLQVAIARNGSEAVQLAKQYRPALILMDIQMPEMDGLEATRQIRADPELAGIPIIALTALVMSGDRDRCLQAGANEYMTKPVRLKKLMQIFRQYLPVSFSPS